jgi:hypothetical protein
LKNGVYGSRATFVKYVYKILEMIGVRKINGAEVIFYKSGAFLLSIKVVLFARDVM